MKIAVPQNILRGALAVVRDAIPSTADQPILSNVLIRTTGDDKAELVGTDLDVTISTEFSCQVQEPGAVTVNAKFLASTVGALTAGIVEFSSSNSSKASLIGGDTSYKMSVLPAADFPKSKAVAGSVYKLPQKTLKDMLRKVSYAMFDNNSRRALNGVNLAADGASFSANASDGRRLSVASRDIEGANGSFSVIVPNKSVKFLQKLLLAEDGDVTLTVDADAIKVNAPTFTFQSRLVAESYPNVSRVIPQSIAAEFPVDRELFLTAIRQSSLACGSELPKIALSVTRGQIVCSAAEEYTDSRATFPVKYDGEDVKVAVNPAYFSDVLTALDSDEITLGVTNAQTPVVFKENGFIGVVMPLRIN